MQSILITIFVQYFDDDEDWNDFVKNIPLSIGLRDVVNMVGRTYKEVGNLMSWDSRLDKYKNKLKSYDKQILDMKAKYDNFVTSDEVYNLIFKIILNIYNLHKTLQKAPFGNLWVFEIDKHFQDCSLILYKTNKNKHFCNIETPCEFLIEIDNKQLLLEMGKNVFMSQNKVKNARSNKFQISNIEY